MNRLTLHLRLRLALCFHRPAALPRLLHASGLPAFSQALARLSTARAAAALSHLPPAQRGAVLRHLPSRQRAALARYATAASPDPAGLQAFRPLALTASLMLAGGAQAGRPLATDDAAVLEAGACQIEVWREQAREARGSALNLGCNPFGSTEIALAASSARESGTEAVTVQGWQVKHLLQAHEEGRVGWAVSVGGLRQRQGGAREAFVNGLATVPLAGDARLLHLNLGAVRRHEGAQATTRARWSLAVDAEVAPQLRAALETYAVTGQRANWALSARYALLPGRLQLDASIGSPFGRESDSAVATLGLVFVSPAFLR